MYYGHASWVALVIFGGMMVMRMFASQRRRGNRPRGPVSPRSLVTDDRQNVAGTEVPPSWETGATSNGTPAAWFADPFFRHDQRFWSGSEWTEHVTDDGVPGIDPPPAAGSPETG